MSKLLLLASILSCATLRERPVAPCGPLNRGERVGKCTCVLTGNVYGWATDVDNEYGCPRNPEGPEAIEI